MISSTTYRHHSEVSVFCSGDVIENARQQIDKEIQDVWESLRSLKSRRNMLATVFRLPPEVFYKIFTYLAGADQQADYNNGNLSWIKISHVCRHWRSMALSCPRLWTSIVFTRPNWSEEMLKRSKAAPLTLKADITHMTPKMVDAVQLALPHISRTKRLHLAASKALMEKLVNGLSKSAPYLQSLLLTTSYSPYLLDNEWYTLPESLFDGYTPRLRRLELTRCNPCWDSLLFSGLTHLQIHNTSASTRPTIQQLLVILGRMPLLRTLELENTLPPPDSAAPAVGLDSVPLLHLTYLHLVGHVLECVRLLKHITFPATARLHLTCQADHDFSGLFPALSSICNGKGGSKALQSFVVESVAPRTIRLQGWPASHIADHPHPPANVDLSLTWLGIPEEAAERVMLEVCAGISLAQLRSLSVYNVYRVEQQSWLETFGRLTKLRTIRVRGSPTYGLVKALSEMGKDQARRNDISLKGISFSGLRRLTIEDTDFEEEGLMDDMIDMLMERSERKVEVRELHLSNCYRLADTDVELLQELVVDVFWDGEEQGFDDSEDSENSEESEDPFSSDDYDSYFGYGYGDF